MASRASWRNVPGEPCSRLGWAAREGRRVGSSLLKRARLVIAAFALYAAMTGATLAFWAFVAAFVAVANAIPDRPQGPQGAEPSPGATFAGTVEIWWGDTLLGIDEAVVTFVDGWLHVEGMRTAFALSRADVEPRPEPIASLLAGIGEGIAQMPGLARPVPRLIRSTRTNRLHLADGTQLRFDLRPGRGDGSRYVVFAQSLARWLEDAPAFGESVLPPDRPHPSVPVGAVLDVTVAALGTVLGFGVATFCGFGWGVLALLLVPGPSLLFAARSLVRLRRYQRRA